MSQRIRLYPDGLCLATLAANLSQVAAMNHAQSDAPLHELRLRTTRSRCHSSKGTTNAAMMYSTMPKTPPVSTLTTTQAMRTTNESMAK